MKTQVFCFAVVMLGVLPAQSQEPTSPILHVTVIERTTNAVNYQYRSGPTNIDFSGTVLLPKAKGSAIVESRPGRTDIDSRIDGLVEPQRFGPEYLTYVLWALTPDGRPHNLGELMSNSSDKAHLRVTTDLQAFALIVTAEPYSAVRQPSDVVVLENRIREDTIGKVLQVRARYELLPRGHYSWQVPENLGRAAYAGPKVSMKEYEALLELYQAQNAIGIARQARADQFAFDTMNKAERLFAEAQQINQTRGDKRAVVQTAREAAQTAEDARLIAEQRSRQSQLAEARAQAADAQRASAQVQEEAQRARIQANAAQAEADAQRVARERAESEAIAARNQAAQAEARAAEAERERAEAVRRVAVSNQVQQDESRKRALRQQILAQLSGALPSRDTARGLVATVPDIGFHGGVLRGTAASDVARVSAIIAAYPGLRIEVEGHSDSASGISWARAEAVRDELISRGVPSSVVNVRGFGDARPLGPNVTARDREANRRVEIVISGDVIGTLALWDRTYNLTPRE